MQYLNSQGTRWLESPAELWMHSRWRATPVLPTGCSLPAGARQTTLRWRRSREQLSHRRIINTQRSIRTSRTLSAYIRSHRTYCRHYPTSFIRHPSDWPDDTDVRLIYIIACRSCLNVIRRRSQRARVSVTPQENSCFRKIIK